MSPQPPEGRIDRSAEREGSLMSVPSHPKDESGPAPRAGLALPGQLLLAPMEGLLDHPLREVLTAVGGIDRCVSEFIRITDQLMPERIAALGAQAAPALKDWLFHERRIEAQVLAIRGRPHVRLAAQVYNDETDFERLAEAVDAWPA